MGHCDPNKIKGCQLLRSYLFGTRKMLLFVVEQVFVPMGRFDQCIVQINNAQQRRERGDQQFKKFPVFKFFFSSHTQTLTEEYLGYTLLPHSTHELHCRFHWVGPTSYFTWNCQGARRGKRSPEWQWLKDKEGKSPSKQNKERSKDQREDLRQNKKHSWLAQFTQGKPRGEEKKHIKREAKGPRGSLFLPPATPLLFVSFGLTCPHSQIMYFPLFSK